MSGPRLTLEAVGLMLTVGTPMPGNAIVSIAAELSTIGNRLDVLG